MQYTQGQSEKPTTRRDTNFNQRIKDIPVACLIISQGAIQRCYVASTADNEDDRKDVAGDDGRGGRRWSGRERGGGGGCVAKEELGEVMAGLLETTMRGTEFVREQRKQ